MFLDDCVGKVILFFSLSLVTLMQFDTWGRIHSSLYQHKMSCAFGCHTVPRCSRSTPSFYSYFQSFSVSVAHVTEEFLFHWTKAHGSRMPLSVKAKMFYFGSLGALAIMCQYARNICTLWKACLVRFFSSVMFGLFLVTSSSLLPFSPSRFFVQSLPSSLLAGHR